MIISMKLIFSKQFSDSSLITLFRRPNFRWGNTHRWGLIYAKLNGCSLQVISLCLLQYETCFFHKLFQFLMEGHSQVEIHLR